MDYGHTLVFGTFPAPVVDDIERVVELAALTEEVGLDLVTLQDHPYLARLADAWTLLTVIAARTRTVRVATNVTNLPLRHPVVLARTVATLDLITGGRVELGLGAGGLLDTIAANAGPRLTPGQSITALDEALTVIREVWTPDGDDIRLAGQHFPLDGAERGPAPAHAVEIWVGGHQPRMLALTGRRADGWLPSSSYGPTAGLTAMNRAIDEAAVGAGRDPASIRRLYNVFDRFDGRDGFLREPAPVWIERLAELTLTEGMSTYILGSDDPGDIRRFAEVAAGVRETVTRERSARTTPAADSRRPGPDGDRA